MIHSRHTIRLQSYNYSNSGWYFVTICSKNMECILNDDLKKVLSKNWLELNKRFPEVKSDDFVIMPNHFHGILQIISCRGEVPSPGHRWQGNTTNISLGRENRAPTQIPALGNIMAYFKYTSTKEINNLYGQGQVIPIFQRNYYERIIRNKIELIKIRAYIRSNPKNWDKEKEKIFVPYVGARFSRPVKPHAPNK